MKATTALVKHSDSLKYRWPPSAVEDEQSDDDHEFDRESWVAENAYFRAEQRGFAPGDDWSDWFEAEADVERARGDDSW